MQKLRLTTLREQAIESIRNAILAGELKSGEQISLRNLATRLDTSIAPVREAIQVLEQQGLLVRSPRGRLSVVRPAYNELSGGILLRGQLEVFAVEQALKHLTPLEWNQLCDDLQTMLTHMEVMTEESQWKAAYKLDIEWHTRLIDAARNPELSRAWRILGLPTRYIVIHSLVSGIHAENLWTEQQVHDHHHLLMVLRKRNPEDCKQTVHAHVLNYIERYPQLQQVLEGGSEP